MNVTVTIPYTYKDIEMVITADVDLMQDGIGPYEFWGQKCYDAGSMKMDSFVITNAYTDVNKDEIAEPISDEIINELQENDNLADELETAALENCPSLEAERADAAYDRWKDERLGL